MIKRDWIAISEQVRQVVKAYRVQTFVNEGDITINVLFDVCQVHVIFEGKDYDKSQFSDGVVVTILSNDIKWRYESAIKGGNLQ